MDQSAMREKAVEELIKVERELKFLQALHPSNAAEQREAFLSGEVQEPTFEYQIISIPEYDFSFFEDDSPVCKLYQERITFMENCVALINARGNDQSFSELSEKIFPIIDLTNTYEDEDKEEERSIGTEEIIIRFEEALSQCGLDDWIIEVSTSISSRLMVRQLDKTIMIHEGVALGEKELEQLIRHEVGVHVFRFENGQKQSEPILHLGTTKGKIAEEGVATFIENPSGPSRIFMRHRAVKFAQEHTFRETWQYLIDEGEDLESAWGIALRMKRGLSSGSSLGAFTKDALYAQGFELVSQFVLSGGDIKSLLAAPIHPSELDLLISEADLKIPDKLPQFLEGLI